MGWHKAWEAGARRNGETLDRGREAALKAADVEIGFGEYQGWTVAQVFEKDRRWLRWAAREKQARRFDCEAIRVFLDHFDGKGER